jgi:integrase
MAWTEKLPSGRYRGRYRLPSGDIITIPETFTHKKAARDAAVEAEGKTKRPGWRDPRVGLTTWGEWHDVWWPSRAIEPQTSASEESMIRNHIMPRWRDVPLAEIRRQDVQAWAVSLVTENLAKEGAEPKYRKPSTARRVLGPFVSSLTAAVDAEVIVANPAVRIKLPPNPEPTPVFLTREQYAAIAEQVEGRADRAVLDFLVGTGVRWGELAGMHVHNLNLERGIVTVIDVTDGIEIKPYPKGRRSRQVPLLQWVVDYLDVPEHPKPCGLPHRHTRRCPSGLLFPAARGGVRDDRNFTQRVFTPAVKAAGLAHLGASLHDLRHTYASWLAQDGIPLGRIAELLGHASTTTTEIYAHFQQTTHDDVAHALRPPQLAPATLAPGQLRAVK